MRLKDPKLIKNGSTHVCIKCWTFLKMGYNKKKECWVTTVANNHFKQSKECNPAQNAKLNAARDGKGLGFRLSPVKPRRLFAEFQLTNQNISRCHEL